MGLVEEISVIRPDEAIKDLIPRWNFSKYGFFATSLIPFYGYNTLDNSIFPTCGLKINVLLKEVIYSDYIFKETSDTIDYSSLHLGAQPYRKFRLGLDYYNSLSPKLVMNPGIQVGFSSKNTIATDIFYVGGYKYNLREKHVPFVGFGINEIFVYNYIQVKVDLTYKLRKSIYINAIANWMGEASGEGGTVEQMFKNIGEYNDHVHFGFGGGITIKSPAGPLSFLVGTNTANFKLRTYLNLGFNF